MRKSIVKAAGGSYDVVFDEPLTEFRKYVLKLNPSHNGLLLTSQAVESAGYARLYQKLFLSLGIQVKTVTLKNGEREKNLATCERLYRLAAKNRLDRRSLIIGLGGGVTT